MAGGIAMTIVIVIIIVADRDSVVAGRETATADFEREIA
jgi:hypothetical protein